MTKEQNKMVTIKIESTELSFEEADNLISAYLEHHGWICFADKIYISNKKIFDIKNVKDREWILDLINKRGERKERLQSTIKGSCND